MKRAVLGLSLLFLSVVWANAQEQIEMPGFKFLRSDEDYAFLKNKLDSTRAWNKIKYLALGEKSFVSVGGDIRTEFQRLRNEEWIKDNNDAALFQRFMLHTDWRFGDHIRVFGQLKSGLTLGRNGPKFPLNDDALDIHQLFIGLHFGHSTIEIGRREIRYGSRRLISVREGTNVRQSFDGARWIWKKERHQVDLLFFAYNPQRVGVFDNSIQTTQLLWGGYWVWNIPQTEDMHTDLYYLGFRNTAPSFDEGRAEEVRHSFGVRHWGSKGTWRYNSEAVLQTGSYDAEGQILAWTLSTELYHQLPGKIDPTIGLKAQVISGDNEAGDGNLETFNPLYPRGGYFGLLALIGPANIFDVHPSFGISFGKSWQLSLDWDVFWRHRLDDGIYFPSARLNVSGQNTTSRYIGHQPGFQLGYGVNRFLEAEISFFHFVAGGFIKEATGGANFSQFGLSVNFKY